MMQLITAFCVKQRAFLLKRSKKWVEQEVAESREVRTRRR